MTSPLKRADRLSADQLMIDGLQKFFAQNATLTFGSRTMAPGDIVKVFQGRIATGKAAVQAEAALRAAVKADLDERAQTTKVVNAFRRFVLATFTESPDTLAAFGLKAPRVGKKSAQTKAQAAVKGGATRKQNGTTGKKQRKQKGAAATPPPEAPAKPTA